MPATATKRQVPEAARRHMVAGVARAICEENYGGALLAEVICAYRWFELWDDPRLDQEGDFVLVNPFVIATSDLTFRILDPTARRWYVRSRKTSTYRDTDHAWQMFLGIAETPMWVQISDEWFIPEQMRGRKVLMAVMTYLQAVSPPFEKYLAVGVRADQTPVVSFVRETG
jgi:hypothetical protein